MQSTSEADTGQRIALEDTDHLEFNAGSVTDAYAEISTTVVCQLPSSPSVRDVKGYILKALLRQMPVLSIEDIHELRILLDVDVTNDASVDEQIAAVFEAAVQIIARWQQSQSEQGRFSA